MNFHMNSFQHMNSFGTSEYELHNWLKEIYVVIILFLFSLSNYCQCNIVGEIFRIWILWFSRKFKNRQGLHYKGNIKKCIEKIQLYESSLTGYWVEKVLKVSKRFNCSKTLWHFENGLTSSFRKRFHPKPKKLIQIH